MKSYLVKYTDKDGNVDYRTHRARDLNEATKKAKAIARRIGVIVMVTEA